MKKAFVFVIGFGILLASTPLVFGADQPLKIGYVDVQKALNFCEAGIAAKKTITEELDKMQKVLSAKQKELDKIKEDLDKRGSVMNESVRTEKEREYQTKTRELERLKQDGEEDLRKKDQDFTTQILKKLTAIIKKMGEDGKYTLIMEMNQPVVLYVSNALDLTDEVIKISDQKEKESKK